MKKIFIALGIAGIVQYIYFQNTALSLRYAGVITENVNGHDVIKEVIMTRDWTVGMIGMVVGVVLVLIGIFYGKQNKNVKPVES